MFDFCGNQMKKKTKVHTQQFLRWSLAQRRKDHSLIRVSEAVTLFSDLESVASAIEGVDPKDNFVHMAKCARDTEEGRRVTRSGFQRLHCCKCHLHHQRAMRLVLFENSWIRYFNRCTTWGRYCCRWRQCWGVQVSSCSEKCNVTTIIIPFTLLSKWSWLLLHGHSLVAKTTRTQNYENHMEQVAWANTGLREKTRWRQFVTQQHWNLAEGHDEKELSKIRRRRQSHDALQDCGVRQSERVLEFHNRDFWIRQTDLSWHYSIFVTVREFPLQK